ncbi:MAG: acyltransferase [Homoserinimonas sp.]
MMAVGKVDGRRDSSRKANFFDLLRLIAAAMVIVGHAWSLSGVRPVPALAGISVHHLGVYIFFTVSGFLLARSWSRDSRPLLFLLRRCLRIFPALVLVVLFTVLVLGPLATTNSQPEYWGSADTWRYLLNAVLIAQYELPGVFTDNPSLAVNGSLWSLGPEFFCYVMLVALGFLNPKFRFALRVLIALVVGAVSIIVPIPSGLKIVAIAVVFFLVGSLLASVRMPARLPLAPGIVGLCLLVPLDDEIGLVAAWITVPYLIISVGSRTGGLAQRIRRLGDPSYGMYLWAFPIQQLVIAESGNPPLWASIGIVLAIATLIGYGSWHFIEKPAVKLGTVASGRSGDSQIRQRRSAAVGVPRSGDNHRHSIEGVPSTNDRIPDLPHSPEA